MAKPLEIVVGRGQQYDPAPGASAYNNPSLAGQDLWVEIYGSGPLPYEDYEVLSTGGFQLLNGLTFSANGQTWFLHTTGLSAPVPGSYSNGFMVPNVLNALVGRLGWIQPTKSGSVTLTGQNTISNSGRYFNDGSFHAIVNPGIIFDLQEDPDLSAAGFNTLLLQMQKSAILRALNGVFNKRDFLERKLLYERYGRQDYLDLPNTYPTFVGKRIIPPRDFDRSMQIDSVSLYFNANCSFNMYLFHDAQPGTPIKTIPVNAIGGQQTIVNFSQFVLNYSQFQKSGVFYFGYFQEDLPSGVYAVNEIIEQINPMFNFGCDMIELQKYGSAGINVNQVAFTLKTHGFNIQLSAFRDHTQLITTTNYIFDELIGLNMAVMVIELIQNSIRSNRTERISEAITSKLYNDLNLAGVESPDLPFVAGIKNQITRELKRVKQEFYPKPRIETNTYDTEAFDGYGVPNVDLFKY